MELMPLGDRVIVEPKQEEEVSQGGVLIPDTAKEKPHQGKVIAVGNGRVTDEGKVIPMQVKVGDTVIYGKYSGTEVKLEGKEYLIISEKDILAIVK